jgi:two-component sensor histidine kinase/PAS domain-containing protein
MRLPFCFEMSRCEGSATASSTGDVPRRLLGLELLHRHSSCTRRLLASSTGGAGRGGRMHESETSGAEDVSDLFDSLPQSIETAEFRIFLDHVPIAIAISKMAGGGECIVYANKAYETLTGQICAEICGKGWSILDSLCLEDEPSRHLSEVLPTCDDFVGTFKCEQPRLLITEVYCGIIEHEEIGKSYRIIALLDVTEREKSQRDEISRRLRDKDLLLRELQHRVKNNLQLITALIRLDARSQRSGDVVNLDRLAGRIEALQLLYQNLTVEGLGQTVDLGHYVGQIATAVMHTYAVDGIRLDLKVDHAPTSINVAMPTGLLVNELMTNAFKYAFSGRTNGIITVRTLREADGRYRVVVADDGVGLPENVTWPVQGKLGAFILQTLRENAVIDFKCESSGDGLRVTIFIANRPKVQKPN